MESNISCPVGNISVNENRVRLTAFLVLLTSISYLVVGHWLIAFFLGIDFFLRGFGYGAYSPLNIVSGWVVGILAIKDKPIDRAPKVFAAQLGFVITDCLLIANVLGWKSGAIGVDALLIAFSFLESVIAFCAGCHVYSFLKKFFPTTVSKQ